MQIKKNLYWFLLMAFVVFALVNILWIQCAKKTKTIDPISGKWKVTAIEQDMAKTELLLSTDPKGKYTELTPQIYNNLKIEKKANGSYFSTLEVGSFIYIDKSGLYIDKNFAVVAPKIEEVEWHAFVRGDSLLYQGHFTRPVQIQEMMMDKNMSRFMPIGLNEQKPADAMAIFFQNQEAQMLLMQQEARFLFELPSEKVLILKGVTLKYNYQLERKTGEFHFTDSTKSAPFRIYLQKEN